MTNSKFIKIIASIALLPAGNTSAALLVREGFDSYATGNFTPTTSVDNDPANAATNALGLTGRFRRNSGANSNFSITSGGLAFSDYSTSAGNRLTANFSTTGSSLQSTLASTVTISAGSTLWSSYLVRYTTISSAAASLSEVRIHGTSGGTGGTSRFRSMGNSSDDPGTTRAGIGYDNGNVTSSGNALVAGTTYMILSSYTNVNSTGSATATQWVLTEAQYADFRDNGFDFSNLNLRAVGIGAENVFSLVSDNATSLSFASGNFLQIAGNTDQAAYDEIRFADSLSDVVTPLPIPEPAVASLSALATLGLLRRRR